MPSSCCANCLTQESTDGGAPLKICVACKMVKYCNRDCQIEHRPQHKTECKKRAMEIHVEALFKQPPKSEDCPICFVHVPLMATGQKYFVCCGKIICSGCVHAVALSTNDEVICPFCRTELSKSNEEKINRFEKRIELFGDTEAMTNLGTFYLNGNFDLPVDLDKSLSLWHRAAKLGNHEALHNIGDAYLNGRGVGRDMKKAKHYWELAAMKGDVMSRHNLGLLEKQNGNMMRALKHYMIASRQGDSDSLNAIQRLFMSGFATRDDYEKALHAHQEYVQEVRTDQRDAAAAYDERMNTYY